MATAEVVPVAEGGCPLQWVARSTSVQALMRLLKIEGVLVPGIGGTGMTEEQHKMSLLGLLHPETLEDLLTGAAQGKLRPDLEKPASDAVDGDAADGNPVASPGVVDTEDEGGAGDEEPRAASDLIPDATR